MPRPAHVQSIEAIAEFRAALLTFAQRAQDALDELDGQVRRAEDWIEHEQPALWKRELRDREDSLQQAKLALQRCLMFPVADEKPSCFEEKAALARAKTRIEDARQRIENVRRYSHELTHESQEYRGRTAGLRDGIEQKVPLAVAALERIISQLELYQHGSPPASKEVTRPQRPADEGH